MPNYGLQYVPTVHGEHYQLAGYSKINLPPVNPLMDWEPYLPVSEYQNARAKKVFFDSRNCTAYGTLNGYETLARFHLFDDFPKNCSERYLGVLAGNTEDGNNPHTVAETVRTFAGVIPEETLPFDETIRTWDEYYHPNPMTGDFVSLGESFLRKFVFGHEWVFNYDDNFPIEEKQSLLMEALTYGPVGVSVKGWKKDKKTGLYKKNRTERDNHWTLLIKAFPGEKWRVFDSYDATIKDLEWDYNFDMAKVFYLSRNTKEGGLGAIVASLRAVVARLTVLLWKR